jgi:hypothetical protein
VRFVNNPSALTFLATGGNQHVFIDPHGSDEWVYKVPASFGELLPWNHERRLARKHPRQPMLRIIYRLLFRPADTSRPHGVSDGASNWAPKSMLDRVWAAYIRWNAQRRFVRMLRLMNYLESIGHGDMLVPYRILPECEVALTVFGVSKTYRGTLLAQRKVRFRKVAEVISHGAWGSLVESQHRLWRAGVAVADVLRFTSWVIMEGQLRLADADSLTDSQKVARSFLSRRILADEERMVRRGANAAEPKASPDEYITFIQRHINRRTLDALWRTSLPEN